MPRRHGYDLLTAPDEKWIAANDQRLDALRDDSFKS